MSVCGTVNQWLHQTSSRLLRLSWIAFGSPRQLSITPQERPLDPSPQASTWTPTPRPTYLQAYLASLACALFTIGRYRNINLLSIAYGYYPLGLGPTNPTRIHLPSETLGLRRTRFARAFTLLIPAFALELAPADLTIYLPRRSTLPYPWRLSWPPTVPSPGPKTRSKSSKVQRCQATASVVGLSPDGLSVQDHSTSELLRTLSRMAASKPTSWLSE